jgi:putative acetyltransferase
MDIKELKIRPETESDREAIYALHLSAFNGRFESELVNKIRVGDNFISELSRVAINDNNVVGHILLSTIVIKKDEKEIQALALAPVGVLPEFQNRGIGSALIKDAIDEARRLKHQIVVVVGHPPYYPRFDFVSATKAGLSAPFDVPEEAFMVAELAPDALKGVSGMVQYPPEFDEDQ